MAFIKETSNKYSIMRDYQKSEIKTREDALYWIALISKNEKISVDSVRVKDYESFHDGTISDTFTKIQNVDSFVDKYKISQIKTSSIIGDFEEKPFAISINLDNGHIRLSCIKKMMADYKKLEEVLGLL